MHMREENNDLWNTFRFAPTKVEVITEDEGFKFELLNSEMDQCGYPQIGFAASESPTFDAWAISYKGFTQSGADQNDLILRVTLALCHKDDDSSVCNTMLRLCEYSLDEAKTAAGETDEDTEATTGETPAKNIAPESYGTGASSNE